MKSSRALLFVGVRLGGTTRRVTLRVRTAACLVAGFMVVPVLMGLGARWSAGLELAQLRTSNAELQLQNESFRTATGELSTQIAALQGVITQLGDRATTDPATAAAIQKLPAITRNRAMGGSPSAGATSQLLLSAAMSTPENTFGVLRDLLGALESRLRVVQNNVDRWEALSRATPSIWPVFGWLTARFGTRSDPFTGEPAFHQGLDISTDKGDPVFATADGIVQAAGWSGDYGNMVVLNHEFGIATRYAHLSAFTVKAGDRVSRGDTLGYVGMTGRASGSHLHYEVLANGKPINPMQLLANQPKP
jgi:murein DD-endopeptidase MepM/ murein hydrolase activator NlpD